MRFIFVIVGMVAVAVAGIGLARRGVGVTEVYCGVVPVVVGLAVFGTPQFVIPIIPFLLVYAFIGTASLGLGRWRGPLVMAWAVLYLTAGLGALMYSAKITLLAIPFRSYTGTELSDPHIVTS